MTRRLLILFTFPAAAGFLAAAGAVQVQFKDDKGQPVADAVVWLTPLDAKPAIAAPAEPVVIEQSGQEYRPYVTPVVTGAKIVFPNRDTVQHHVYSLSKPKRFEIPLYGGESKEAVVFDQPGVVTIGCNIHDWMIAYVLILETPHYAKSGDTGTAAIADLPPGRYRLEAWHPRLSGRVEREIAVTKSDTISQEITLKLKPDRRIRRAPDAAGGGYK